MSETSDASHATCCEDVAVTDYKREVYVRATKILAGPAVDGYARILGSREAARAVAMARALSRAGDRAAACEALTLYSTCRDVALAGARALLRGLRKTLACGFPAADFLAGHLISRAPARRWARSDAALEAALAGDAAALRTARALVGMTRPQARVRWEVTYRRVMQAIQRSQPNPPPPPRRTRRHGRACG